MRNLPGFRLRRFGFLLAALCLLATQACEPIRQELNGEAGRAVSTPSSGSEPDTHGAVGTGDWKNEMEGLASWYGQDFNGRLTASGEVYDMYEMTAAHKTLPLQAIVKVHNLDNGKTVEVRINDRGPYVSGRIIDLSRKAARALGMRNEGTAHVRLEIVR